MILEKIKKFLKKYKTPIVFSLSFIFALIAGFITQMESIKRENELIKNNDYAFSAEGKEVSTDRVYKENTIVTTPDERVKKEDIIIPEAFPESTIPKEPLVKKEDLEKERKTLKTASDNLFSPKMPLSGGISKIFSLSPLYSETMEDWRSHEALDISAPLGSKVSCIEKGTVVSLGKDPFLGIYIRIKHSGGFESLYANLHAETTVIENQEIEKGHIIGYVGESALSESKDEPHLHFELIKDGKRVNPKEYIK